MNPFNPVTTKKKKKNECIFYYGYFSIWSHLFPYNRINIFYENSIINYVSFIYFIVPISTVIYYIFF